MWFSILKTFYGYLEIQTLSIKMYVCNKTYLHNINRDFSLPLAIEMYACFFSGHPYIESTTVLSDMS